MAIGYLRMSVGRGSASTRLEHPVFVVGTLARVDRRPTYPQNENLVPAHPHQFFRRNKGGLGAGGVRASLNVGANFVRNELCRGVVIRREDNANLPLLPCAVCRAVTPETVNRD